MMTLEKLFYFRFALNYIFIALFTLEPRAYFRLCFVCLNDIQPCAVRPFFGIFRSDYLADLTGLKLIIKGNYLAVYLCSDSFITGIGL